MAVNSPLSSSFCFKAAPACLKRRTRMLRVNVIYAERTSNWLEPLGGSVCGIFLSSLMLFSGPAQAADFVETGKCLLGNCPGALASCLADKTCVQNLVCLQNCNGRPDESECQIRCGDLYASPAVEAFTECAVSEKQCVKQRVEKDTFPVPRDNSLVRSFDLKDFQGRWAITMGLNNLFDVFDCQVHQFKQQSNGDLYGDIDWRIQLSDGDFTERHAVQTFKQDPKKPGYLRNDNNDFLNYTDDWYVLGFKPDEYAVIYYRGNNDAWAGYGGCTVYTRDLQFPEKYRDEVNKTLLPMNLKLDSFKKVDNRCPSHPALTAIERVKSSVADLNPGPQSTGVPSVQAK